MKKHAGFTLTEMLIVVVIMAILATIAVPSYREAVRRSDRRAAQSAMMEIANRERQVFVSNRAFQDEAELAFTLPAELEGKYTYTITVDNAASPPTYTIDFDCDRRPGSRRRPEPGQLGRKDPGGEMVAMKHDLHRSQRGISLIEVLIAMVILAIGLLGLVGLQGRLHVTQVESYQRAQALILLQDMTNRIALNRTDALAYVTVEPIGTGMAGGCPVANVTRVERDVREWCEFLIGASETLGGASVGAMVGGRGCVEEIDTDEYMITVAWQGMAPTVAPAARRTPTLSRVAPACTTVPRARPASTTSAVAS